MNDPIVTANPADLAATPSWAAIRLELLDCGPDHKSARRLFGELRHHVVRLQVRDQPLRDVRILSVGATDEVDETIEGFLVRDVDINGREILTRPARVVDYATVVAIGVY